LGGLASSWEVVRVTALEKAEAKAREVEELDNGLAKAIFAR